LAALIFSAAALPQGLLAQPPVFTVSEALLDEFVAALPHPEEWAMSTDPDAEELARIEALNPGREKDVRAVLTDSARCSAPVIEAGTRRALRVVGARLGPDKLRRLIAFYRSDEFRRLDSVDTQRQKGAVLSAAQEEEFSRVMAAHPEARDFATGVQGSGDIIAKDPVFVRDVSRCGAAQAAAFARAKLTYRR
jgi:hypothetical protein